jgi:Holliday junction resolvasome RuvABC DNA-binding subunit
VRCDGRAGDALRGPARLLFGLAIDPNRADARTLEVLPGIGPARAAAIVAERERRPFADVVDLERVAGIGPKTRGRLAPWLELPGGAALQRNR